MTDKYYVIAEVDKRQPNESHSSVWPKLVAYSFSSEKILLEEGFGHGLMGGTLDLKDFDTSQWEDIFQATDSEWFKKYIDNSLLPKFKTESDFIDLLKKHCNEIKTINY